MLTIVCRTGDVVSGFGAALNGPLMLLSPSSCYVNVPGVTMTGQYNQHFVRDVGLSFLVVGISFLVGARSPGNRLVLWGTASLWVCGHALFCLWKVAAVISAHSAISRDLAPVTTPAATGVAPTLWVAKAIVEDADANFARPLVFNGSKAGN